MQHSKKQPHKKPQKSFNNYSRYSGMVIQMGVIIGAGTFGGIKLDQKFGLNFPLFTVILSFLSVILALYYILKDLLKK